MPENFNNLDTREKANLMAAIGGLKNDAGTYVDVAGDSMTGLLTVPTLVSTGMASLSSADIPTLTSTTATLKSLTVRPLTPLSGATNAPFSLVASTASQAFISFSGVFISNASYGGTASTNAFVIPVYHETQKVWGYLSAQKLL